MINERFFLRAVAGAANIHAYLKTNNGGKVSRLPAFLYHQNKPRQKIMR